MHRLLVPSEQLASDSPVLPKEAANHLKVLRPKDGEEIELFDGSGKSRRFSVEGGGKNFRLAALSPVCTAPRASRSLTLFACVTKGSRWDWTIEKATELGVTRIVPVVSARTIVRIGADEQEAKRARWIRIAEDAARQSDAKWIPEIHEPVSFAESLPLVRETTCFVGALTNPPPQPLLQELMNMQQAAFPVPHSLGSRFARRVCFPKGRKPPQGAVTLKAMDLLNVVILLGHCHKPCLISMQAHRGRPCRLSGRWKSTPCSSSRMRGDGTSRTTPCSPLRGCVRQG